MSVQDMLSYWMNQGLTPNTPAPDANSNVMNSRNQILNNFLTPNTYNTGDSLSSAYPWMNSLTPALGILNNASPSLSTQQGVVPQLIRQMLSGQSQTGGQVPSTLSGGLRSDLLNSNMQQALYNQQNAPPPATPPTPAAPAAPVQTGVRNTTLQDIQNQIAQMPQGQDKSTAMNSYMNMVSRIKPGMDLPSFMTLPTGILDTFGMSPTQPVYK